MVTSGLLIWTDRNNVTIMYSGHPLREAPCKLRLSSLDWVRAAPHSDLNNIYLFIDVFIYFLKAHSPVNRTGTPQGSGSEQITTASQYRCFQITLPEKHFVKTILSECAVRHSDLHNIYWLIEKLVAPSRVTSGLLIWTVDRTNFTFVNIVVFRSPSSRSALWRLMYLLMYLFIHSFIYLCIYLCIYWYIYVFIYLLIYLCKAYSPVNGTGSPQGSCSEQTPQYCCFHITLLGKHFVMTIISECAARHSYLSNIYLFNYLLKTCCPVNSTGSLTSGAPDLNRSQQLHKFWRRSVA